MTVDTRSEFDFKYSTTPLGESKNKIVRVSEGTAEQRNIATDRLHDRQIALCCIYKWR